MLLPQTRHNGEGRQALHAAHDKAEPGAERYAEQDPVCAEGDACAGDRHDAARKVRHQEAVHDPVMHGQRALGGRGLADRPPAMPARSPERQGPQP